jgi:GxxExxY protein
MWRTHSCVEYELKKRRLHISPQQAIPVIYESVRIETGFHADLIVENKVIWRSSPWRQSRPCTRSKLLSYLKLADKLLGCSSTSMLS